MAIIYDDTRPIIETEGSRITITPRESIWRSRRIRVGTRAIRGRGAAAVFRDSGPLGTRWQPAPRDNEGFQEVEVLLTRHAIIRQHDVDVHVWAGTEEHLRLMNATLGMVPPQHLAWVVHSSEKPEGFRFVNTTGRGQLSYMGGANVARDNPDTPFDDRRCILITYGAMWQHRNRAACPTVFHEIGHVMTRHGLYIDRNSQIYRDLAAEAPPSRNPAARRGGIGEQLCNAYMYLLCFSSADRRLHNFGAARHTVQRSRAARDALRAAPAFTRLDQEWQDRFSE